MSLPSIVGVSGVAEVLWPDMSEEEMRALERSADQIRTAVGRVLS